jgi:drug/metabolite transporter (DMT)-like permease
MPASPSRSGTLHGLAAVMLWSTVATAFKLSLRLLDPLQLLLYASWTSLGVLLALLAIQRRLHLLLRSTAAELRRSALLGLLNPFLYYAVLFQAYARLPAQLAQPLNYTWAITLSLLSIPLLGQRPSARDLGAALVAYLGVVVISTRGDVLSMRVEDPVGVVLALGSTVIWALYWLLNARDDRDPVLALALNFALGSPAVLLATALLSEPWPVPAAGLLGAAYVGLFEMGLTFVLWLKALRLAPSATRLSTLIFISPFASLVLIHFVLREAIHPATVLGLLLIVAGIAWQQLGK